jgi:hypothetical protein
MKKYISFGLTAFVLIAGMVSLFPRGVKAGDPTTSDTGVAASQTTHNQESAATEKNQQSLMAAQPIPSPLTYSMERANLIAKAKFEAKQGTVGYVALIGPMGQLVAYYTIQGKVSSLNSLLTTPQQVHCSEGSTNGEYSCVAVDSPDLDGSYGPNPSGIFFFTTSGQYVEYSGNYLYSDQPMTYASQPLLVQTQK